MSAKSEVKPKRQLIDLTDEEDEQPPLKRTKALGEKALLHKCDADRGALALMAAVPDDELLEVQWSETSIAAWPAPRSVDWSKVYRDVFVKFAPREKYDITPEAVYSYIRKFPHLLATFAREEAEEEMMDAADALCNALEADLPDTDTED